MAEICGKYETNFWILHPFQGGYLKCSALDTEMIFHSHANKFHKKGCALGLILKVRILGTWKGLL